LLKLKKSEIEIIKTELESRQSSIAQSWNVDKNSQDYVNLNFTKANSISCKNPQKTRFSIYRLKTRANSELKISAKFNIKTNKC
jgi:hypothetical protein